MEPLNLLIVAIRESWQPLISDSLTQAGYQFTVQKAESKQQALAACSLTKFDLVISNCTLPDGQVADLLLVLGRLSPCLVMSEGHCPVSSERALSLLATDFYITSSEQSSWLSAMETTLSQWKSKAQENIESFQHNSTLLHKKVLAVFEEELSTDPATETQANHSISNAFKIILEALDLSRIYLYTRKSLPNGEETIVQENEVSAISVKRRVANNTEFPYFKRWNALFESKLPVRSDLTSLPASEQQWLNARDTQSILAVPIHYNDNWQGFIGVEDMLNSRQWSDSEVDLVKSLASLIQQKQLSLHAQTLRNTNLVF